MLTYKAFDQPEASPCSSVALASTLKVFVVPAATVQLWEALAAVPELTKEVVEFVPSPQSKVYFTWSPSGSVALVE